MHCESVLNKATIMNQHDDLPSPPEITEDELKKCRESGDYCPILFEWYKFVGALCNFFACISPQSPAFSQIEPLHHAVLIGLLNRCSRLMLANIALSHNGLYGETTSILDRCIFESCIKVVWLCELSSKTKFEQFIADGLKTELKFKEKINANISSRNNKTLVIEGRMLASIDHYVASSGLSEEQIELINKLPSLLDMIGGKQQELLYIVAQKIGSHHVHGTWPSLFLHYVRLEENGFFSPRDHDCETHANQYVIIPLFVLEAMGSFVRFVFSRQEDMENCLGLIKATKDEVLKLNKEISGNDFELFSSI